MSIWLVELLAAAIVAVHLAVTLRISSEPAVVLLRRFGLIALSSWIAEDTCIRLYGIYAYSPDWSLFIDQMPLMVALIWPTVILSAHALARHLCGRRGHPLVPWVGAGLVFADASMIEPIAVSARLWWWFEPGLFDVPIIGLLGWALFAGLCMALIERARTRLMPLVAPAGVHLGLLAMWWGLLRWVNHPIPTAAAIVAVWSVSILAAMAAWRTPPRVPRAELLARVPAAAFFFVLLVVSGGLAVDGLALYALAFAPPYLALTLRTAS